MNEWLALDTLCARFGTVTVLDGISLSLARGEIGCLLGGSGTGKSTLLRVIAGFETPSAGTIRLAGQLIASAPQSVPGWQRCC